MILLRNFANIFKIPELTQKIAFTLGVLVVFQLGRLIPAIGVNGALLSEWLDQAALLRGFLSYFDTFSGGTLTQCTIFALGVSPYITASIFMQIASFSVPWLEDKQKEGEQGRREINQYTRYLALGLSIAYSFSMAMMLLHQNATQMPGLVIYPAWWSFVPLFVLSIATGAMFVMWLGEQISLFGIGNGASLLIFAGIVSTLPSKVALLLTLNPIKAFLAVAIFILISGCIVYLEKGERKIPVHYARRVIGQRVYGGQSSYIPFKINTVGVMPVILASSLLNVPTLIVGFLSGWFPGLSAITSMFAAGGPLYLVCEFALIIAFTFFYAALQLNPEKLADDLKKGGGFIPGVRPGKQTAEYFNRILDRIGLVGAVYLGVLAVAPTIIVNMLLDVPFIMSGTSLLIMVGVALETSAAIETYLVEYKYGSFLSSGRMKTNRAVA